MAYININEIDKTNVTNAISNNLNVTLLPINATDGPSDEPVLVTRYEDFVSVFGNNPDPSSSLMTSWEYAANLLLNKMPVMVRRVTHFLNADGTNSHKKAGNDSTGLLPGVNTAGALIKGPNTLGLENTMEIAKPIIGEIVTLQDESDNPVNYLEEGEARLQVSCIGTMSKSGSRGSFQMTTQWMTNKNKGASYKTQAGTAFGTWTQASANYMDVAVGRTKIQFGGEYLAGGATSQYSPNKTKIKMLQVGNTPLNITTKEGAKSGDFTIYNATGVDITLDVVNEAIQANRDYLLLDSGCYIMLSKELSIPKVQGDTSSVGSEEPVLATIPSIFIEGEFYGAVNIYLLNSTDNTNFIQYLRLSYLFIEKSYGDSLGDLKLPPIASYSMPVRNVGDSVDNYQEMDANDNFNLFEVNYRYPGTCGNYISAAINTIVNSGVYLEIYKNDSLIEKICLVSFRYKNENGYWNNYNITDDAEEIWYRLLQTFGMQERPSDQELAQMTTVADLKPALQTLKTDYITISLNEKIKLQHITNIIASICNLTRATRYDLTGGSNPSDDDVIHEVSKIFKPMSDKYLYDFKFIASGTFVDTYTPPNAITVVPQVKRRYIEDAMIECAEKRGDCLAFLDIPQGIGRDDTLDYFSHLTTSYATAYAPWVRLRLDSGATKACPPSFIALLSIAKSVQRGGKVYAPPAGVNRAIVDNVISTSFDIPADYIDYWADNHSQFVNPIVYLDGYGYCIFGQKTLYNTAQVTTNQTGSALQYLNTRLVANEIKKRIFKTCIELTFELNNLHTWLAFKTKMEPLMNELLKNHSVVDYDFIMDERTMTDYDIRTNHIVGTIRVAIATTAEKFDIDFELTPNGVNFVSTMDQFE